ncbi:hypothetical protein EW145_g2049 [Phellinidium pouzarii]|uniref:RZ-type domain-containing protein n=1 Tax=Phellinidium pouzarii TaxID=167371 RepID=A0A4S4LE05_9AGAM|nr:hypothetical protein EW145_g2049 [Phellinidium pouzarii]
MTTPGLREEEAKRHLQDILRGTSQELRQEYAISIGRAAPATGLLTVSSSMRCLRKHFEPVTVHLEVMLLLHADFRKISGSGADVFRSSSVSLDPQQTQEHLRRFLRDDFRFRTSTAMYPFVGLLSNATSLNNTWPASLKETAFSYWMRWHRALYSLLDINLEHIIENVEKCMEEFMAARSFEEEVIAVGSTSGSVVMGPLLEVFFEYLSRFKNASASHKTLGPFILKVGNWVTAWADDICSPNPTFSDVLTTANSRAFVTNYLKERAQRIVNIVEREQANLDRTAARRFSSMASVASQKDIGHLLNVLAGQYEGPGEVRKDGPRHSNDFVAISDIQVAPTDDELTCKLPPFLPVNIPNAPHPLPSDSMERLFDIQFRLLREELLAPLRTSVQVTLEDMSAPSFRKTQLSEIKKKKGGRYNYQDRHDSVMFNVYTNVEFSKLEMDSRRGMVIEVRMNTPPGSARSDKASTRASYWSNGGGKRLMQGGLVALMWRQHERVEVYLGVVSSTNEKLVEAAKANKERLSVRIQFFDALINFKALEKLRKNDKSNKATDEGLLIESNVVFEAIRPFLESLKREPETIPFRKYLPHPSSSSLSDIHIDPPAYSLVPNFAFELNSLFREGVERNHLRLETSNPDSIATARIELAQRSRLDSSQAEAIIDALTRELALIQGPPGTGKTYMGEELIRVLVENKVKPILLIAFTNHALDHMLTSVIESGITSKVVRLGGRSTDEMIKKYSIEELEKVANRSRLSRSLKSEFRDMKEVEEEIMALLKRFIETNIPSHVLVDSHLSILYPDHIQNLNLAPSWIQQLYHMQSLDSDDSKDAWKAVRMKGKEETRDDSLYSFWKTGKDLDFLHVHREPRRISNEIVGGGDLHNCFSTLLSSQTNDDAADSLSVSSEGADDDVGVESKRQQMIPPVLGSAQNTYSQTPKQIGNAPSFELSDLRQSAVSRLNISDLKDAVEFFELYGEPRIPQVPTSDRSLDDLLDCEDVWSFSASERSRIDAHWVTEFRDFSYRTQKQRFEDLFAKHQDLRERQRNRDEEIRLELMRDSDLIGAAKVIAMLKGLGPRVMIVEEAGQVQESHVLASLVDSVNHLILIGDPLQLRPTLNNYGLSMDNPQGGELFKFDMSLMERLSSTGLPMSRLDVQRPMQSMVEEKTLFPSTILSRRVAMIKDLVKYLLRQGCYSNEGSIVILCAYLGQLAKVRDALKSEMTVVLDERDEVALAEREGDTEAQGEVSVERVDVTQKVKIRSVDNYQGEEADIVILSLVRNSGAGQERNQQDIVGSRTPPKIGFLKELEPSQGTLDELIITLPGCHHSFTVETLDGHCHMEDYYEKDEQDKWLKLKSPATGYKQPPTCPTCRRAIRSPRYGRVYKRADLDILERNTATAMTRSLNSAKTEFNAFDRISAREKLASETWPSPASEFSFSQEALKASTKERKRVLSSTQDFPVEWNVLDPGKPLHGIWNVASKHWLRHIEPMRSAYQQARNVALTRSAHMKAWESAFSSFYRQEIEAAVQDPLNAPYDIQDRAMQAAKRNVGQSKPLADKRFCVEAIWLTLDIRFLLVDLAQGWLRGQSKGGRSPEHSKLWSIYIAFILATCERDAGVALRIAEESDSQRQMLSSRILVLNSGLETFKFNLRVSQDAGLSKEDRESLIERIKVKIEDTKNSITEEVKRRRGNKQVPREQFENLFKNPAGAILEEWKELESSLCNNAIYSPISYEEKKQVVGALMSNWDFTHSGHFYTCPNGHTFVISECGGAMETARCPECFETIGGTGHNLVSSNRRDFEFEAIAREQGAQESPWAWGR